MLRFAPSPTCDLDLNKLRIAILNYLLSRQRNEPFLVRIEDLDTEYNIEGKDSEIMQILEKFALIHTSVFHQSEHLNLYQTLAIKLLKEKKAFICTCIDNNATSCLNNCEHLSTQEYTQLKDANEKFVIRIKKPNQSIAYHDMIQGDISTSIDQIDTFVILNENAKPTYNFASACDDMINNISLIIRDKTHLLNTSKQIHIQNLLNYETKTSYAHIPQISHLDSNSSLLSLFENGFLPDAILNYLLLLGTKNLPKEIFTLPQAIEFFDLNMLLASQEAFDLNKLHAINREHLKLIDDKKLSTLFDFADADIGKIAKLYLEECTTTKALKEKIDSIFKPKDFSLGVGKEMKLLSDIIAKAPYFETFDKLQKYLSMQSGLKDEKLLKPLTFLLTGNNTGPELSEIYPFIKPYILEIAS